MRNRLILIAFLLLMGGWPAYSQQVTGNITAVDTSGACTTANGYVKTQLLSNDSSLVVQVSGTFSGTLQFLVTVDGSTYSTVLSYPPNSTTGATTTTGTGKWSVSVGGWKGFCIDASALASGTAAITINHNAGVNTGTLTGGGGGGSGTVTSVSGITNEISVASPTTTPVISLPTTLKAPGYVAQTTNTIDPRAYGCKGDGTDTATAATACWQAAEAYMQASGGALYCAAGTTWTLNRVQLSDGDSIIGPTPLGSTQGCVIFTSVDAAFVPAAPTSYLTTVSIRNLRIYNGSNPIDLPFGNNMDIENIYTQGATGCSVLMVDGERWNIDTINVSNNANSGFAALCTNDPSKSLFSGSLTPSTGQYGMARSTVHNLVAQGDGTHGISWLWWGPGNLGESHGDLFTCFFTCFVGINRHGYMNDGSHSALTDSSLENWNLDHVASGSTALPIGVDLEGYVSNSYIAGYDPALNGELMTTEMNVGECANSVISNSQFLNSVDNVTTFGLNLGSFGNCSLVSISGGVYSASTFNSNAPSVIGSVLGPTNLFTGAILSDQLNLGAQVSLIGNGINSTPATSSFYVRRGTGSGGNFTNDFVSSGAAFTLNEPCVGGCGQESFVVGTGGVTANHLVQTDTSNPSEVVATTTGVYGIALSTQSATATVVVQRYGQAICIADNAFTAGDLLIIGTTTPSDCKDSGQTSPANISIATRIVGVALNTGSGGGNITVELLPAVFGKQIGAGAGGIAETICTGTIALPTSAVSSGGKYGASSSTPLQTTCTGMLTTDAVTLTFNADPTATTGYVPSINGMLTILAYPDSGGGKIDLYLVNNTSASITPGAATLNYRVTR